MEAGVFCDELATITNLSGVSRGFTRILFTIRGDTSDTWRHLSLNVQRSTLPHKSRANRTYRNGASWRYTHTCHGE